MSMNRGSSIQNGLIDPVTLIFDSLTPKAQHFEYIPRSFPIPSLNTLESFVFELCCGQTDKQTDTQTAPNMLPTPTDRVGMGKWPRDGTTWLRTDDINANGDLDGALLTRSDAREEPRMTSINPVEHQHAPVVPHTCRQSTSRRPATATSRRPLALVPADDRRHSALGEARHPRAGVQFELDVLRYRLELESLCTSTEALSVSGGRSRLKRVYVITRDFFLNNAFAYGTLRPTNNATAYIVSADRIHTISLLKPVYQ